MLSYFDKLREKPIAERRRVATSLTITIVVIIVIIYIIYLVFRAFVFPSDPHSPPPPGSAITSPY